jgi:hypothetical protein
VPPRSPGSRRSDQIAAASQNRQISTAPFREPAPPAIAERMTELGADVWAIALELAGACLKADREALGGRLR